MIKVFISHSRRDAELVKVIDNNFNLAGVKPMFMEFTPQSEPPYKKIEENVSIANAIFLFLTENVKVSDYTQNWISFEVGLAEKSGKPLYIIEDVHNKIHFPVPYLTDYILYEPTKIQDWLQIEKILKKLEKTIEKTKLPFALAFFSGSIGALADNKKMIRGTLIGGTVGLILGGIINSLTPDEQPKAIKIKCPECKISFNLYSRFTRFPCPSCRANLIRRKKWKPKSH